jgi:flagellin
MVRTVGINTNSVELANRRSYDIATRAVNVSAERLATGKRINRASDDPAGSVLLSDLQFQELTIKSKLKKLDREEQWLGARDGQSSVLADLVLELKALTVQGANRAGLSEEEKASIQGQIDATLDGIVYVGTNARFLGEQVFQGFTLASLGGVAGGSADGSGGGSEVRYTLNDLRSGGKLNVRDRDVEQADKVVDAVVSAQASARAGFGLAAREIDTKRNSLLTELVGVKDLQSKIGDTDYFAETSNLVRNQVLQQAAIFTTQLAKSLQAKTVEQLLGGLKQA